MLIRKFISLLLALSLPALFAPAQIKEDGQKLEAGKPLERELAAGQSHTYKITLQAGQFMRVTVEQKGVDVAHQSLDAGFLPNP